jgi:hypothetical protein
MSMNAPSWRAGVGIFGIAASAPIGQIGHVGYAGCASPGDASAMESGAAAGRNAAETISGEPPNDDSGPLAAIGISGGSPFSFAVVGDTRPALMDDTRAYPTAVISEIYARIEALAPRPVFAISTGDYVFASPHGTAAWSQLDLYLTARAKYSGPLFPVMGNHECTGGTASNCGFGAVDGTTNNYRAFVSKLLGPLHRTLPYYEVDVAETDRRWTAKFLLLAANAWSAAQAQWFEEAMRRPTTYTFVIRHEPAAAIAAPGVVPSEVIMGRYPYTLCIAGHTHTYERSGPRELIVGNGGAPLSSQVFGFGLVRQQADLTVTVEMVDSGSGWVDAKSRFVLRP